MRKTRSDALLLNLPAARQEQIIEWCDVPKTETCVGGYQFAREQLAADGVKVSLHALSSFYSDWHLERDLEISVDREEQVFANTGDRKKAREAGEELLLRLGLAQQDPKLILAAAQVADSRRNLDLQEESGKTKAAHKERSLAQKDTEIKIAKEKFRRDTAELFVAWYEKAEAEKIMKSGATRADKIEALGQAMFGDDW